MNWQSLAAVVLLALVALGCASTTVTTTVLPPHRLEQPICPSAVIIHDSPGDVPPGGHIVARLRVQGGEMGLGDEDIRRKLREAAAKLGANRIFATEVTTPSTLAALGMTLVQGLNVQQRDQVRAEALADPNHSTQASVPPATDPDFYGKGLAYAIFVPEDTLRTNLECTR